MSGRHNGRRFAPAICLLFAASAALASAAPARVVDELSRPYFPAISIQRDESGVPPEAPGFAPQRAASASGIVRCGAAIGTAQLTLRADVITTAGHVLIGAGGAARGGACTFEPGGGSAVQIDMRSVQAGSARPLSDPAARDWAVARLLAPIAGATPVGLGALAKFPSGVTMYGGGHGRADGLAGERCLARHAIGTSPQGIREIAIDCNAAPGASGAALLDAQHRAVAIYVGYRSATPDETQPFSRTHYNFAISIEGPFRRALLSMAGARR